MDNTMPNLKDAPVPLQDDDVVGFGQYKDIKLKDLPMDYLQWMVNNQNEYPRLQRTVRWTLVINWIRSKK